MAPITSVLRNRHQDKKIESLLRRKKEPNRLDHGSVEKAPGSIPSIKTTATKESVRELRMKENKTTTTKKKPQAKGFMSKVLNWEVESGPGDLK